jgi:hypothetical protein
LLEEVNATGQGFVRMKIHGLIGVLAVLLAVFAATPGVMAQSKKGVVKPPKVVAEPAASPDAAESGPEGKKGAEGAEGKAGAEPEKDAKPAESKAGEPAAAREEVDVEEVEPEILDKTFAMPEDVMIRARVARSDFPGPLVIKWRYGGEGLGGDPVGGVFWAKPQPKKFPTLDEPEIKEPEEGFEDPDDLGDKLALGQWSQWLPMHTFSRGKAFPGLRMLSVTAHKPGKGKNVMDGAAGLGPVAADFEFEISWQGRTLKTVRETGITGATVGLAIRANTLVSGVNPDSPKFLEGVTGLKDYVAGRMAFLEALPWAKGPKPTLFFFVTDLGGYGQGSGYKIRHTNPEISELELRTVRQIGINGLRSGPSFLNQWIKEDKGIGPEFKRGRIGRGGGYVSGSFDAEASTNEPDVGCPFKEGIIETKEASAKQAVDAAKAGVTQEVWALTVDEIGPVFGKTAEKGAHITTCPRCQEQFREYLKTFGLEPEEVGANSWEEVKPLDATAEENAGWKLNKFKARSMYYQSLFINFASAQMFIRLRNAMAAENEKKEKAAAGTPEANQPYMYSYALRGNTFLMGGGGLDFFDFYRFADNGFVHETSNRDPKVWNWDGYLLDVGRMIGREQGTKLGIYVKPHRGAPIQRILASCSRGAQMIFLYTYGPDYWKGDGFSGSLELLTLCSKAAAMIARVEPHVYKRPFAEPARVGIVQPRSSEIWRRFGAGDAWNPAWENCKWTYTGLRHAKVMIDPLDEVMLENNDLSAYQVLYVMGPNITARSIPKLKAFVEGGGTLYTAGYGLVADETNAARKELLDLLGLTGRTPVEIWRRVGVYGATGYSNFMSETSQLKKPQTPGPVTGTGIFAGCVMEPEIGREVLSPAPGTQVVATFADGKAAGTLRKLGKGQVITLGFYPGLDYMAPNLTGQLDMVKGYKAEALGFISRPALEKVMPRTDVPLANVETVLLEGQGGAKALILMNWAYEFGALVKSNKGTRGTRQVADAENVPVRVRDLPGVKKVYSAAMDKEVPFKVDGKDVVVTLPKLEEGEVLIFD